MKASTLTKTESSATTADFSNVIVQYVADYEIMRSIQRVFQKAEKWKRECCGKKTGRRFCESYGCASLDELLEPLKRFRLRGRK